MVSTRKPATPFTARGEKRRAALRPRPPGPPHPPEGLGAPPRPQPPGPRESWAPAGSGSGPAAHPTARTLRGGGRGGRGAACGPRPPPPARTRVPEHGLLPVFPQDQRVRLAPLRPGGEAGLPTHGQGAPLSAPPPRPREDPPPPPLPALPPRAWLGGHLEASSPSSCPSRLCFLKLMAWTKATHQGNCPTTVVCRGQWTAAASPRLSPLSVRGRK